MTFDDQQLDDLLKDVAVTSSLHKSLREIPDSRIEANPAQPRKGRAKFLLALAAVLFVSALIGYLWVNDEKPNTIAQSGRATIDVVDLERSMNSNESKLQELDLLIEKQKARALERKVANKRMRSRIRGLKVNEKHAFTLSNACEVALDLGVPLEEMRGDLDLILKEFPNTQGAQLAKALIQKHQTQN